MDKKKQDAQLHHILSRKSHIVLENLIYSILVRLESEEEMSPKLRADMYELLSMVMPHLSSLTKYFDGLEEVVND